MACKPRALAIRALNLSQLPRGPLTLQSGYCWSPYQQRQNPVPDGRAEKITEIASGASTTATSVVIPYCTAFNQHRASSPWEQYEIERGTKSQLVPPIFSKKVATMQAPATSTMVLTSSIADYVCSSMFDVKFEGTDCLAFKYSSSGPAIMRQRNQVLNENNHLRLRSSEDLTNEYLTWCIFLLHRLTVPRFAKTNYQNQKPAANAQH